MSVLGPSEEAIKSDARAMAGLGNELSGLLAMAAEGGVLAVPPLIPRLTLAAGAAAYFGAAYGRVAADPPRHDWEASPPPPNAAVRSAFDTGGDPLWARHLMEHRRASRHRDLTWARMTDRPAVLADYLETLSLRLVACSYWLGCALATAERIEGWWLDHPGGRGSTTKARRGALNLQAQLWRVSLSNSRALTRDLEPKISSPAGILSLYFFLRAEFSDASPEDLDLTRREFFVQKARAKVRPLLLDIAVVLPSPREILRPTEIRRWEGASGDAWSQKASGATKWTIRES